MKILSSSSDGSDRLESPHHLLPRLPPRAGDHADDDHPTPHIGGDSVIFLFENNVVDYNDDEEYV